MSARKRNDKRIAALRLEGLSVREIAKREGISEYTVRMGMMTHGIKERRIKLDWNYWRSCPIDIERRLSCLSDKRLEELPEPARRLIKLLVRDIKNLLELIKRRGSVCEVLEQANKYSWHIATCRSLKAMGSPCTCGFNDWNQSRYYESIRWRPRSD